MTQCRQRRLRTGGIYIAVLGTALIVALLGMTALIGQRLQNRMVVASADIRQAQLNANTAIELGLLAMKQDTNWRTTNSNGNWFVSRGTNAGSCTLSVTDVDAPLDTNLADDPSDPVVMLGIGYSGEAVQRVKVTVDPRKGPLSCLRSAVAVGDTATLQSNTLRTGGLVSANTISATSAQVYGKVEAVSVGGSTYNSGTTQITSAKRPTMPDWTAVFNYYRTNGTEININSLPTSLPNMARNPSVTDNDEYWYGVPPVDFALSDATTQRQTGTGGHAACLEVNRSSRRAGAFQYVDSYLKPNTDYQINAKVYFTGSWASNYFVINLYVQLADGTVLTPVKGTAEYKANLPNPGWYDIAATLHSPTWNGNLRTAILIVNSDNTSGNSGDFYIDNIDIREQATGRFIYRQVLSPGVNPYGSTNAEGIYWINCGGSKLVIERSRILGTLLVVNPGANSCIGNGPISWSPAVAGYPALLVDADTPDNADFALNATNRALGEKENDVNYNPAGAAHEDFGQDTNELNDIYHSSIRGLIAVRDDLTFQNRTLVRGQVVVGDDLINSSGELEIEFLPDSLLNPPPGFTAPYSYLRRAATVQKAVLP